MHDVPAGWVRDQGLGVGWLNGPDVTRVLKMLLDDVGILHGFSPVVRVCYGANEGERARACCTMPGRISRTYSISASVVPRPRLQRKAPCRYGPGTPMARNTCEGSSEPELQAEPVDSATPCRSRLIIRASPSTPAKATLVVLGRRGTSAPWMRTSGICSWIPCSRHCCNCCCRSHS